MFLGHSDILSHNCSFEGTT